MATALRASSRPASQDEQESIPDPSGHEEQHPNAFPRPPFLAVMAHLGILALATAGAVLLGGGLGVFIYGLLR
jgi:hypothetical protein